MLEGHYSPVWVMFSIVVATLTSYIALDTSQRIKHATRKAAHIWLWTSGIAMGVGIWAMHFIGMLSFNLPVSVRYDLFLTSTSLVIAILSSTFALFIASQEKLPPLRLLVSSLLMGGGIAAMHYMGMAAMGMQPGIVYRPLLVLASILIAVVTACVALYIVFRFSRDARSHYGLKACAAVLMGLAICSMHYTGMAAADFPLGSVCSVGNDGISSTGLALPITVITLLVLAIALITSVLDTRLETRTSILAHSLAEANQELTYMALHDNLTKLPNRLLLEDRLRQTILTASRESTRFYLMFMDMDGFKGVNDSFGHHVGDQLLIEFAARIKSTIRAPDTLARISGDEFVLMVSNGGFSSASTVANKLVNVMRQPFMIEGYPIRVSISLGIALYPNNGETMDSLLRNADAAMYHAKSSGRDQYCFFESWMTINAHDQFNKLQDLRDAIDKHQFELFYQPKFSAPTGSMIGLEALIRWKHPERGMIPPNDFIPIAEKSGLIVRIGDWVLNEACRQMAEWRQEGKNWCVAVNLSAIQFSHDGLVFSVKDALERHQLPAAMLTLEITESTAMHDVEASLKILRELTEMGVHISIDDFGTGYSSLLYLKRLPANELKIDRGFVSQLEHDNEDASIVSAIVSLGQSLNMKIVAEGVETEAQQKFLTDVGCTVLQGYLFGKPQPASWFVGRDYLPVEVEALLSAKVA